MNSLPLHAALLVLLASSVSGASMVILERAISTNSESDLPINTYLAKVDPVWRLCKDMHRNLQGLLCRQGRRGNEDTKQQIRELEEKIEELKNEEMDSKDEEISSENEEMGSKNEEICTENEEMSSKNEEMGLKNEEMGSKYEEMSLKNEGLKEDKLEQDQRMTNLSSRLEVLPLILQRLDKLEEFQLTLKREDEPAVVTEEIPVTNSSCPRPFEEVDGECFYVNITMRSSWSDSRKDCQSYGGDLAAPDNLKSLQTYLKTLPDQDDYNYYWIGASRINYDQQFIWYIPPKVGRQLEFPVKVSRRYNCIVLPYYQNYRPQNINCDSKYNFACQFFKTETG